MEDLFFDVTAYAYAHRGLWGGSRVPENSLAAFHSAREHRFGVELDVRLSADGVVHVFHDATMERLCRLSAPFDSLTAEQLAKTFLPNGFPVPTLEAVLELMGDMPILIELKVEAPGGDLAERVAATIADHPGRLAVMSFDDPTVARLRELVADRPVGLLIPPEALIWEQAVAMKASRGHAMGCDYLAPHLSSLATAQKAGSGLPLVTWTLRDPTELEIARKYSAAPIFESIDPALVPSLGTGLAKPS